MVNKHLQKNITAKAELNQESNSSESPSNFGRGKLRAKGKGPNVVVEAQNPAPAAVEETTTQTSQVEPTQIEHVDNDSSDSEVEVENTPLYEAVETPTVKKRGRPLGSKDRPRQEGDKPRGRPLGSKDRVPEPGEVVKKRGRPRKHPIMVSNEQNGTSSLLGAATSMFSFINSPLGLDGSVGVIWNSDGSISASGKRRGRPLGSKNKTKSEHDIDDATGSVSSNKKRNAEDGEHEGEEGENQESLYDPISGEMKKKLGRPLGSKDKAKRARWGSKVAVKVGDEGDEEIVWTKSFPRST